MTTIELLETIVMSHESELRNTIDNATARTFEITESNNCIYTTFRDIFTIIWLI